jgi:uncharacterized protein (DUF2336 family)
MDAARSHQFRSPPDAFPEIAPLIRASKTGGIDTRPVLARVLTDLFVARSFHTREELAQFEALIEPLIAVIDPLAAIAVARKLAPHPETPRTVIEALLRRNDEAAYQALRDTTTLDARTLDILAERGSRFVGVAIASRSTLADATARILAARDETVIDLALARRVDHELPSDVASSLIARARRNPDLARLILAWPKLRFSQACSLFLDAEPQERLAMAAEATRRAFLTRARPSAFLRADIDAAIRELVGADRHRLAAALVAWLGLPRDEAATIVADSTGEALILGLRACGARPESIVTLLLRRGVHLSRSVERIFALAHLARETSATGAATIISAFTEAKPRPVRHVGQTGARDTNRGEPISTSTTRVDIPAAGAFRRRDRGR